MRYNKTYLIDTKSEVEAAEISYKTNSPEVILEMKEQYCRLCHALNSLPEKQGRRIDAHYLLGMSRKEIADAEGVSESAVNQSIGIGLRAMKAILCNLENCLVKCPFRLL